VSDNVRVMLRAGEADPRQRAAWSELWILLLSPQKTEGLPNACRRREGSSDACDAPCIEDVFYDIRP
jgi:hypothetical protein